MAFQEAKAPNSAGMKPSEIALNRLPKRIDKSAKSIS